MQQRAPAGCFSIKVPCLVTCHGVGTGYSLWQTPWELGVEVNHPRHPCCILWRSDSLCISKRRMQRLTAGEATFGGINVDSPRLIVNDMVLCNFRCSFHPPKTNANGATTQFASRDPHYEKL